MELAPWSVHCIYIPLANEKAFLIKEIKEETVEDQ